MSASIKDEWNKQVWQNYPQVLKHFDQECRKMEIDLKATRIQMFQDGFKRFPKKTKVSNRGNSQETCRTKPQNEWQKSIETLHKKSCHRMLYYYDVYKKPFYKPDKHHIDSKVPDKFQNYTSLIMRSQTEWKPFRDSHVHTYSATGEPKWMYRNTIHNSNPSLTNNEKNIPTFSNKILKPPESDNVETIALKTFANKSDYHEKLPPLHGNKPINESAKKFGDREYLKQRTTNQQSSINQWVLPNKRMHRVKQMIVSSKNRESASSKSSLNAHENTNTMPIASGSQGKENFIDYHQNLKQTDFKNFNQKLDFLTKNENKREAKLYRNKNKPDFPALKKCTSIKQKENPSKRKTSPKVVFWNNKKEIIRADTLNYAKDFSDNMPADLEDDDADIPDRHVLFAEMAESAEENSITSDESSNEGEVNTTALRGKKKIAETRFGISAESAPPTVSWRKSDGPFSRLTLRSPPPRKSFSQQATKKSMFLEDSQKGKTENSYSKQLLQNSTTNQEVKFSKTKIVSLPTEEISSSEAIDDIEVDRILAKVDMLVVDMDGAASKKVAFAKKLEKVQYIPARPKRPSQRKSQQYTNELL